MKEDKIISEIVSSIVKDINPKLVYLFGSYAKGIANENSDIDLCIIKERVKSKKELIRKLRLKLWNCPRSLDLILMSEKDFNKRKDVWWTLQGQIAKNGKIVYENKL